MFRRVMMRATRMGAVAEAAGGTRALLYYGAAGLATARFEHYPATAWDAMMESHLKSALLVSQAFLVTFRAAKRDAGSIINVSSTYGVVSPDQSMYERQRLGGQEWFKPVGY